MFACTAYAQIPILADLFSHVTHEHEDCADTTVAGQEPDYPSQNVKHRECSCMQRLQEDRR